MIFIHSTPRAALLALLVLLLTPTLAQDAHAQEVLDGVVEDFAASKDLWWDQIEPIARGLFGLLAGIELIITGILYGLRRGEIDDLLGRLLLKFMIIAFMYTVLLQGRSWLPEFVGGFSFVGEVLTGQDLTPSALIGLGATSMMEVMEAGVGLNILFNGVQVFLVFFTGLSLFISFTLVAMRMVLVTVESILVVALGSLFVAFAANRITASFTDAYFVYAASVGIKALLLNVVVAVGMDLAQGWISQLEGMTLLEFALPLQITAAAFTFAALAWYLPGVAAARLTQNVSFGIAGALQTH